MKRVRLKSFIFDANPEVGEPGEGTSSSEMSITAGSPVPGVSYNFV